MQTEKFPVIKEKRHVLSLKLKPNPGFKDTTGSAETNDPNHFHPMEVYRNVNIDSSDFDSIAEILMRHAVIHSADRLYRLREIEFYLHSDNHPDPYVHCHPLQKEFGKIYVHRRGKSFREGTYRGSDLTFGGSDRWFGILIRGIIPMSESKEAKEADGPCLSVNQFLASHGHDNLTAYSQLKNDPDAGKLISVKYDPTPLHNNALIKGSRIGLSDAHPEYKNRPYRYGLSGYKYKKKFTT